MWFRLLFNARLEDNAIFKATSALELFDYMMRAGDLSKLLFVKVEAKHKSDVWVNIGATVTYQDRSVYFDKEILKDNDRLDEACQQMWVRAVRLKRDLKNARRRKGPVERRFQMILEMIEDNRKLGKW